MGHWGDAAVHARLQTDRSGLANRQLVGHPARPASWGPDPATMSSNGPQWPGPSVHTCETKDAARSLRCLVIGAHPSAAGITREFTSAGFDVAFEESGLAGFAAMLDWHPHALLVTAPVPDVSVETLCRHIRLRSEIPLIVVDDTPDGEARVRELEAGADDVVAPSGNGRELLARTRAVMRRLERARLNAMTDDGWLQVGALRLASGSQQVINGGRPVALSPKEFLLLRLLMENVGKVVHRDGIIDAVWGVDALPGSNVVDRQIRSLRSKLGQDQAGCIETVVGRGYRMRDKEAEALAWGAKPSGAHGFAAVHEVTDDIA
jgi:DNA-binding response OmpR family regulator